MDGSQSCVLPGEDDEGFGGAIDNCGTLPSQPTPCFTGSDTYREEHVGHVLLDGTFILDDTFVLWNTHAFASQHGLINTEGRGGEAENSAVGRDFVADMNGNNVSWY